MVVEPSGMVVAPSNMEVETSSMVVVQGQSRDQDATGVENLGILLVTATSRTLQSV